MFLGSKGALAFLKLCHFVARPPRTRELRGCSDRGRGNQRLPIGLSQPDLGSGDMHEFHPRPIGHTYTVSISGELRKSGLRPMLGRGSCDYPELSLLSLHREKTRLCSFINLALPPLTFTSHEIS